MAYVGRDVDPNDAMLPVSDGEHPLNYCRLFKLTNASEKHIDECIARVVSDDSCDGETVVEFYMPNGDFIADYPLSTLWSHADDKFKLSAVNGSHVIDANDLCDILTDIEANQLIKES